MTTPRDTIAGLSERLRAPVWNEETMRGWDSWRDMIVKNRGSLPRDCFESFLDGIDEERAEAATQLDALSARVKDCEEVLADKRRLAREIDIALHGEEGASKQASLCDLVEPAIRLRAIVKELEAVNRLLDDTGDLLQARVKELEAENKRLLKYMVPISKDGNHVFIDGTGDVEIDHEGALRSRATRAEQERETLDASWRETLRVERDCTLNATRLKDKFKQERDALEETTRRHEQTLKDNGTGSHTEAVVLVVDLRRQLQAALQERDEAYERLKPFAEGSIDVSGAAIIIGYPSAEPTLKAARDLIRRLAAGPEKEK